MRNPLSNNLTRKIRSRIGNPKLIPWYLLKYGFYTILILLIGLGACFTYEAIVPETVPPFDKLHHEHTDLDPYLCSNGPLIIDGYSHEERYAGLSNAIAILDETNPTVANWVRRMNEEGRLVFFEKKDFNDPCVNAHSAMAKFNFLDRKLYLHKGIFAESDGTIAVTLAHEFRHSRQSYTKMVRYALSSFFTENGDASIMENDAMLYEMEAFTAIFGPGYAD